MKTYKIWGCKLFLHTRKLVILWPIVDFRSVRRKAKPEIWLFFKTESLNLENNPNQNNLFDHFEANLSSPLEAKANKTHISNHSPTSLFLFLMVIINNVTKSKGKKLVQIVCFIPTENIHLKYNLKVINFWRRRRLNLRSLMQPLKTFSVELTKTHWAVWI